VISVILLWPAIRLTVKTIVDYRAAKGMRFFFRICADSTGQGILHIEREKMG
jgi:hypothetical protein